MAARASLWLLPLAILPVLGQTMESPRTPLIFHAASRSLRPIIGMTGSSYLGSAVHADIDFGSVAPDQKRAIIVTGNRVQYIRNLQNIHESVTEPGGAIASVDRILWSSDSATAILYSSASGQLQWITNGETNLAVDLPEGSRILAADITARVVITAAGGRLYRITPDLAPVQIAVLGDPTAAVLQDDGQTIYVSDGAMGQILQFQYEAGSFRQTVAVEPVKETAALALSVDGGTLYAANKSSRSIDAYQISDGTLTATLSLDWPPSSFEAIGGQAFVLNPEAKTGEPYSVLSTRAGLKELFIPTGAVQQ